MRCSFPSSQFTTFILFPFGLALSTAISQFITSCKADSQNPRRLVLKSFRGHHGRSSPTRASRPSRFRPVPIHALIRSRLDFPHSLQHRRGGAFRHVHPAPDMVLHPLHPGMRRYLLPSREKAHKLIPCSQVKQPATTDACGLLPTFGRAVLTSFNSCSSLRRRHSSLRRFT